MRRRRAKVKTGRDIDHGSSVFLRCIALEHPGNAEEAFPFTVPVVRALDMLPLPTPVTFLVGENGSGKSTILEGIAAATHLPTIGSESAEFDTTLSAARALADRLTLTWTRRTRTGFFLRAEDFFGFVKQLTSLRADLAREIADATSHYESEGRSAHARGLRVLPLGRSLAELHARYGADLDAHSHGESFLELFQSRFIPGGLYLLDEPEAALSPQSQLALIALMSDMVAQHAQFIIATHSPMLLAFPGATIYSCDRVPIAAVPYGELENIALLRDFLSDPARFLRHLLRPNE